MKLTPLAKAFVALVILGVVGYTGYHYYGDEIKSWSTGEKRRRQERRQAGNRARSRRTTSTARQDRRSRSQEGRHRRAAANVGDGKLGRKLVVGINTWAGHTPGIVANGGLDPAAGNYLQDEVRPRREVRAHRGSGGEADRVHQGRHRHHVGHRRFVGARGVDAGRAEHPGQGDHPAGLVARRRRHRLAEDDQLASRISRARPSPRRATRRRTGCCSICSRSRA